MNIDKVKEKYESNFRELKENSLSTVPANQISSQYYCEKKVDLNQKHEIDKPERVREGQEYHKASEESAKSISSEDLWRQIENGETCHLVEFPLTVEYSGQRLTGKADVIIFDNCKPMLVLEKKTTSNPDYLFQNQKYQAWIYSFILDELGFRTDELKIGILAPYSGYESRLWSIDTGIRYNVLF